MKAVAFFTCSIVLYYAIDSVHAVDLDSYDVKAEVRRVLGSICETPALHGALKCLRCPSLESIEHAHGYQGGIIFGKFFPRDKVSILRYCRHGLAEGCRNATAPLRAAIKFVLDKNDRRAVQLFQEEKEKARYLGVIAAGPSVVDLLDDHNNEISLGGYVMERVGAYSAFDWVQMLIERTHKGKKGLINALSILNIMESIAVALERLLATGVAHCDGHLKNFMIRGIKKIDFNQYKAALKREYQIKNNVKNGKLKKSPLFSRLDIESRFLSSPPTDDAINGHRVLLFPSQIAFIDAGFCEIIKPKTVTCETVKRNLFDLLVSFLPSLDTYQPSHPSECVYTSNSFFKSVRQREIDYARRDHVACILMKIHSLIQPYVTPFGQASRRYRENVERQHLDRVLHGFTEIRQQEKDLFCIQK